MSEITITAIKVSGNEHSKHLALISKSMPSPLSKGKSAKSPSFSKQDEDLDLMISDSEVDEPPETDEVTETRGIKVIDDSWMSCGVGEYRLILTRKVNSGDGFMKLEAKITISSEYPVRPPYVESFKAATTESESVTEVNEWFNELRAMEAEGRKDV